MNWSGTITNPNPTGTSTGLNTFISLNDTTANWPNLTGWEIKITAGTGNGQIRSIQSNTAITIVINGTWDVIPDATSQYELVLVLRNQDHIVGNLTLSSGVITELEDSATILFDGNYNIIFANSVKCNWGKTKSTLVTFQPNQIEIQGKASFWGYIYFQANVSNSIYYSYIYVIDATYGLILGSSTGTGDCSNIHHLKFKNLGNNFIQRGYAADTQNTKISNILYKGGYAPSKLNCNNFANTNYREEYERLWIENCASSGINFASLTSAKIQIVKDSVFNYSFSNSLTNIRGDADKRIFLIDNCFSTKKDSAYLAKGQNVDTMGKTFISRNVSQMSQEIDNAYAHPMSIISRFNDYSALESRYHYAFNVTAASEVTSDNDFICGRLQADPLNVDVSESTSSTENPMQYRGLTSPRTNAKTTPNKLLELDNIEVKNITSNSVDITFDCKNSHIGTMVSQDSSSGQRVLYIANTSDFEQEEIVEIGFGTERQEEGRIDTIQDGISITLKENLQYTHTATQADIIKKQLRWVALPFIRYGCMSGTYDNQTPIPDIESWGDIFCGFANEYFGETYEWKKYGHSITIEELQQRTTYYVKILAYTPCGTIIENGEISFTTEASEDYTDPGIENVRESTSYTFAASNKVGILDLPSINNVRDGIKFDNETKEGISDHALESDVRKNIKYDNETKTGTLEVSGVTEESIYNYFVDGSRAEAFKNTDMIKRILGLSKENIRLFNPVYDANHRLLSATFKIYETKVSCESDTDAIASYDVTGEYNIAGELINFKEVIV